MGYDLNKWRLSIYFNIILPSSSREISIPFTFSDWIIMCCSYLWRLTPANLNTLNHGRNSGNRDCDRTHMAFSKNIDFNIHLETPTANLNGLPVIKTISAHASTMSLLHRSYPHANRSKGHGNIFSKVSWNFYCHLQLRICSIFSKRKHFLLTLIKQKLQPHNSWNGAPYSESSSTAYPNENQRGGYVRRLWLRTRLTIHNG
jgi:hypothetical protein